MSIPSVLSYHPAFNPDTTIFVRRDYGDSWTVVHMTYFPSGNFMKKSYNFDVFAQALMFAADFL